MLKATSGYKRQECWHETHTALNFYNLLLRVSYNCQATDKSKGYDQRYIQGKQNNKYIKTVTVVC